MRCPPPAAGWFGGAVAPALAAVVTHLDVPVDIDRDAARAAARAELAKPIYEAARPPFAVRIIRWVADRLTEVLDRIAEATPGGWYGVVVLLGVLGVVVYATMRRVGLVRRSAARRDGLLFGNGRRGAAEHRAAADGAAARGDWDTAVLERFRAIVRTLEERGLIDERPGRTADEAAAAGAAILSGLAQELTDAAAAFDSIMYGGRSATADLDHWLRDLDALIHSARPFAADTSAEAAV
jgi:hypothetical protein